MTDCLLRVADSQCRTAVDIEDVPDCIDAVEQALRRCDGWTHLDVTYCPSALFATEIAAVLGELCQLGIVADARWAPAQWLAECRRCGPLDEQSLLDVVASHRSHPSGSFPQSLSVSRVDVPQRDRSLPLEDKGESWDPVSLACAARLIGTAYGTIYGHFKPVASAGRLWPLSLHLWTNQRHTRELCDLFWFDDENWFLNQLSAARPPQAIGSWFGQDEYVTDFLEHGAALVVISADLSRTGSKYGNRSVLFSSIEVGAVMHQMYLSSPVLGLRIRPFGGFNAAQLKKDLGADLEPLLGVLVAASPH